jgi:hypothetical protein
MMQGMLSPASLAALAPTTPASALGISQPVQRVRAVEVPAPHAALPAPGSSTGRDGAAIPGKPLPRGSLLDMMV